MSIKFNASHQCVWKHWAELEKMIACRKQIEAGLTEAAVKALGHLHKKHAGGLVQNEDLIKGGWFDLVSPDLNNWMKSGHPLLSIGIECIGAEHLHPGSDDPCLAYVYSHFRKVNKDDKSTDQLGSLKWLTPPGFSKTFDQRGRGYVFTMELAPLTPEDICNAAKLELYFTDPVKTLIDWYKANEKSVLKTFDVSKGKKN